MSVVGSSVNGSLAELCASLGHSAALPAAAHNATERPSPALVWGVGLSFVTLISLCAAVGIGLMPLLSKRLYYRALTYFVGLGVGSLSGSAIFHLIPQAFELVGDGASHGYLEKAWVVVAGVYLFYVTDKLLQLAFKARKREVAAPTTRAKSVSEARDPSDMELMLATVANGLTPDSDALKTVTEKEEDGGSGGSEKDMASQAHGMCAHDHAVSYKSGDSVIGTVAWMIVFGDGLHNLIDGLSIGAAFSESLLSGISISVAVLCEEFPHELGDVAILISAGMTLRQALTYNLLSALTCYVGFVLGVLLGELAEAQVYIFALAGGMFLYISLASMVPEMNGTVETELKRGVWRGLRCMGLQAAGVLTGLVLMFLMSYYGSLIKF